MCSHLLCADDSSQLPDIVMILRTYLGHPRFFNQLSNGVDVVSMAGEWLTATANTNMFTYEISPVFILMEHITLKKMREIIGYKGGDSILAPGITDEK